MRILYVTNYFPPHYIGGYELHCGRVAQWLAEEGHSVRVLTGDFYLPERANEAELPGVDVRRDLQLRYWTDVTDLGFWLREWKDTACFRRHLADFQPDVTVLWNMRKLATGILLEAQEKAPTMLYHLMDEWLAELPRSNGLPQFWHRPARSLPGRLLKPPLRALYNKLFTPDLSHWQPRHAVLVSKALGRLVEKAGLSIPHTHVSYITYEPERFNLDFSRPDRPGDPLRFLWAGRLCEGKGLYTCLDALDILHARQPAGWTVDFCGPLDSEEADRFQPRLEKAPWKGQVRYLGSLPYAAMPEQYRDHDAFLFTSQVHEGLPGTIVEAFAAGMAVIGTLTGGTQDVLQPDENCLVYEMGDAAGLADAMEKLLTDTPLRHRLSASVRAFAADQCSNTAVFPRLLQFYESCREMDG